MVSAHSSSFQQILLAFTIGIASFTSIGCIDELQTLMKSLPSTVPALILGDVNVDLNDSPHAAVWGSSLWSLEDQSHSGIHNITTNVMVPKLPCLRSKCRILFVFCLFLTAVEYTHVQLLLWFLSVCKV